MEDAADIWHNDINPYLGNDKYKPTQIDELVSVAGDAIKGLIVGRRAALKKQREARERVALLRKEREAAASDNDKEMLAAFKKEMAAVKDEGMDDGSDTAREPETVH